MSKLLRVLALLFAVALVAAACGNDDDDGGGAAPAPAATEAPAPAEEEMADGCGYATDGDVRGVDKENGVITIGSSQPFTGRAAVAGEGRQALSVVAAEGSVGGLG